MNTIASLLQKTSRTFAVTIPLLPEPTRQEVGIAYLLFRVVDTFEDATLWPASQRESALAEIARILQEDDRPAARALARRCEEQPPVARPEYLELLQELPFVLESCGSTRPAAAEQVRRHAAKTATGMIDFVRRSDGTGGLRLQTLQDLRDYCYVVAGMVGEMLTELFLLERPELGPLGPYLRARARFFGEGLQVVNILKDAKDDAEDGRVYLPAAVPHGDVFALARADLGKAVEYTRALHEGGAPDGIVGFNLLLVRLASRSLDVVEARGPGAKMPRPEVLATVNEVLSAIDRGLPMSAVDGASAAQAI
jgi:farnesyl-diphosphate farnesyltransferase